jgi:hypothetical protein
VGRFRRNAVDEIIAVGKAARFFRIQAGMSQAPLGGELGVTFQQIQNYENGLNRHWLRPPAEDRQAVQADHGLLSKEHHRRHGQYQRNRRAHRQTANDADAVQQFRIPACVTSWQISSRCS